MDSCFKTKRAREESPLMRNGRMLLEELIASGDGKHNPIRVGFFTMHPSVPDGESHAEIGCIRGRMLFMSPEYVTTGFATENWILVEILTGRRISYLLPVRGFQLDGSLDNKQLIEIVHPAISIEETGQQDLIALAKLVSSCTHREAEDWPIMTYVAKELRRISKFYRLIRADKMASCFKIAKEVKVETPCMKGRMVLEELISSSDGKCRPKAPESNKNYTTADDIRRW